MTKDGKDELAPLALVWRPRAHLDRESIALYLGIERHAPTSALNAIRKIDSALEHVCLFPDAGGRFRSERLAHKEYRTALAGPYIIFYRYNQETLTVYRILHQRQGMDTYAMVMLDE